MTPPARRVRTRFFRIVRSKPAQTAGLLAVISALSLTALHPLMFGALPASPDGPLHLYRLVALDHAVRHGLLWPRYLPGMLYGYGVPLFNYYSPLYLYPSELFHLTGLSFVNSLLAGLALYMLLGALGAYLLGRAWNGPVAGIAVAGAYLYAPYLLYEALRRGVLAQYAALAILPWVLWAFWRTARQGRRRDLLLAVICYSLLVLMHNITALYGTALLTAYCLYLWWTSPDPPRAFLRLAVVLILPLGLTAFFWLPALAETSYVHIERVTHYVPVLDFHNNFQSLGEIFAPPLTADLTQLHPPVPRTLGWPQIVLALLGLALIVWPGVASPDERKRLYAPSLLALGALAGLVFLDTRASSWIWQIVPLMHYIQFPWRLLGPASLLLALLAGSGVVMVARRIPWAAVRAVWVAVCLTAFIGYGLPWLYGVYLPDQPASIVDAQNFERETGWLAGTGEGEYVPRWTTELPDPARLIGLYAQNEVIPRLQPNPQISVETADWGLTRAALTFTARTDTALVFDWIYFPGWWARLDGEKALIVPANPQGLIRVDVPAGTHELELGFGLTPLRLGALIGSGLSLALTAGAMMFPIYRSGRGETEETPQAQVLGQRSAVAVMIATALVGGLMFAGKVFLVDNLETPIKRERFANGLQAGLQTPVQANFNHEITLLGCDLPSNRIASGSPTRLALYWQLSGGMVNEDYSSVVYLRDAAGHIVWQIIAQHPGDYPTTDWVPGFYVQERVVLQAPSGTPPGTYTIEVGLYSHTAGRNLDVFDAGGNPLGVTAPIGTLEVTRPPRPARLGDLGYEQGFNAHLTDDLTFLAMTPLPENGEVGQPLAVIWAWRARSNLQQVYHARLIWLDQGGVVAASSPAVPPATGYPTDQWRRGDVWRGVHLLYIPGRLERGTYQVAVQLTDASDSPVGEYFVIGEMAVSTPERRFEAPPMAVTANVAWENGIALLGYDLPRRRVSQGDGLHLTLHWQPQNEITQSLTVFVHLCDGGGHIVAQQDHIPVNGSRPTTGWAPAEVVSDPYSLFISSDVPPGRYHLRVGWYDAVTGVRVPLPDGGDFWALPDTITVIP